MAADDFLNTPADQGSPTDLAGSPYSGNRPASGSRRATPGEVLSQGFQGAQNAGDFLGLDVEFTASQDPNQAYSAGPLDLVAPPTTYDPVADTGMDPVVEPAPLPDNDAVQEFAEAPSAFEFGEDLGSEEGFSPAETPARSKTPLLVGALAFAALAGAGVYFYPTLSEQFLGSKTEVARVDPKPTPAATKPPTPEPTRAPTFEVATKGASSTPAGVPGALVTPDASPSPAHDSGPVAQVPTTVPTPSSGGQTSGGDLLQALLSNPVSSSSGSAATAATAAAFPNLDSPEYAWAAEDRLQMIWRGSEVPLGAVSGPAKTLMPHVGSVRVFMTTGDVFEGRLYAVGQNHVWIDAAPGRIGLDGERVERIEVLPPAPTGLITKAGEFDVAGGKRVRVRVPGGMLYGTVLKAEGDEVILAREGGGRVRVQASDIEDLGTGRTIVVGH